MRHLFPQASIPLDRLADPGEVRPQFYEGGQWIVPAEQVPVNGGGKATQKSHDCLQPPGICSRGWDFSLSGQKLKQREQVASVPAGAASHVDRRGLRPPAA